MPRARIGTPSEAFALGLKPSAFLSPRANTAEGLPIRALGIP